MSTTAGPFADCLLAAIDFETTGRSAGRDRVVQMGAFGDGGLRFCTLVHTPKRIHPEAQKVHGISAADLEGKPAFGAAFAAFLDALDGARAGAGAGAGKRTLLVAHNGSNFDFRVLVYEMHRHGISLDTLRSRSVHLCDTLPAARAVNGKTASNKLAALFQQVTGKELAGAHDALADCEALYAVAQHPPLQAAAQVESLDQWLQRVGELRGIELFCPRCKNDVWDNRLQNAAKQAAGASANGGLGGAGASLLPDLCCQDKSKCGWSSNNAWRYPRDRAPAPSARVQCPRRGDEPTAAPRGSASTHAAGSAPEPSAQLHDQIVCSVGAQPACAGVIGVCKNGKPCTVCTAGRGCRWRGKPGHAPLPPAAAPERQGGDGI